MTRLVVYSLALDRDDPRPDLIWQFDQSVTTLRLHNRDVAVVLFLYDHVPAELAEICHRNRVIVRHQGSYAERLARACPSGWHALASYPLLHRYLNFEDVAEFGPTQILA